MKNEDNSKGEEGNELDLKKTISGTKSQAVDSINEQIREEINQDTKTNGKEYDTNKNEKLNEIQKDKKEEYNNTKKVSSMSNKNDDEDVSEGIYELVDEIENEIVEMLLKAYLPELSATLGVYIPLIVVNCIIFARAESFAFKNGPILSLADGLGMGLGFTCAITILSAIRELLGSGTLLGYQVMPETYQPMAIMTKVTGGFITLGILLIVVGFLKKKLADRKAAGKEEEA